MPEQRRYVEVDVFGRIPLAGNPVAVVVDGSGLDDVAMQQFASWTNLSETTFLVPPTDAARAQGADYRVRIFTPGGELPFAGHPTLGTAHAWLESGGVPAREGVVVQECGIGLVTLRRDEVGLSFAAPGFLRSGPVDEPTLAEASAALGIERSAIVSSQWVDNGPGWFAVELPSVDELLAVEPNLAGFGEHGIGAFAHYVDDERLIEVRAFIPQIGVVEDPVTGSLNAGLARWLIESGRVTGSYLAGQGHALGRDGLVRVTRDGDQIWVGGQTQTVVTGTVTL
ncbi:PhzF family phenazine biosynthesis protein [Gryllotalpicola protaetiae]|uniref:PhzF family phenazine biosynthesis protein n=1 Tax=Gryllotalpicola protaetiae TaxID=2419771 RepID=A0A387BJ43_9MICO|nr:PhzF family phenazine biosynthesis protein [Gryllotalpicola protaetiae]AYG02252.1 PhzF family phenazine biosynthesis protein [Gryllotalpicola protaetiae]